MAEGRAQARGRAPCAASDPRMVDHSPARPFTALTAVKVRSMLPRICCLPLRLSLWRQELMPLRPERPQLLGDLMRLRQLRWREHTPECLCQRDMRLQEVCLEACEMLLVRLERRGIQPVRIQEHILQLLSGRPHSLPEWLGRRAIGAERLLHLRFLVLVEIQGV